MWMLICLIVAIPCGTIFGARKALVIGNSTYVYIPPLKNPTYDADLIAPTLSAVGFSVTKLKDLNAEQMNKALQDFYGQLSPSDVALVYFSGHGFQYKEQSRLVPVDFHAKYDYEVIASTLSLDTILEALSSARAKPKIVILDACRDTPALAPGVSRAITRGLAEVKASDDETLVCYSTKHGSVAADNPDLSNSVYTFALSQEIVKPGRPIEGVLKEVTKRVKDASNGEQSPWVYGNLTEDFYFMQGAAWPSPTLTPPLSTPPPVALSIPTPEEGIPTSLRQFINGIWSHNRSNDASDWASDFASHVNYCYYNGGGLADRNFIQRDREKLVDRYPSRNYRFTDAAVQMQPDGNSARVHYTYSYSYGGARKSASGSCRVSLTVRQTSGRWYIAEYDETVDRR
jgi:hypothetical protein